MPSIPDLKSCLYCTAVIKKWAHFCLNSTNGYVLNHVKQSTVSYLAINLEKESDLVKDSLLKKNNDTHVWDIIMQNSQE